MEHQTERVVVQFDMNPDGSFGDPFEQPRPSGVSSTVLRWALIIAALATLGAFAFLALWLAMVLVPIALGAALVAYGIMRYRIWQAGRSG